MSTTPDPSQWTTDDEMVVERQDIIASITAAADSGHPGRPRPQRRRHTPEQVAAAFEPPGLTDSERDQLRACRPAMTTAPLT